MFIKLLLNNKLFNLYTYLSIDILIIVYFLKVYLSFSQSIYYYYYDFYYYNFLNKFNKLLLLLLSFHYY